MDPVTIAATAVSLLSPYLGKLAGKAGEKLAEAAGNAAWKTTAELYASLKARFAGDHCAEGALQDLEQTPDDEDRQAAVRSQLKKLLAAEPEFARQLLDLLKAADEAGADAVFSTNIHGNIENFAQINTVHGDFYMGTPKARAP